MKNEKKKVLEKNTNKYDSELVKESSRVMTIQEEVTRKLHVENLFVGRKYNVSFVAKKIK